MEAGKTAGRLVVVQARSDGSLDQGGGGGNGEKNSTGAPCSAHAHFLPKPCHQGVLTNLLVHTSRLCWSLLFQEAFPRQCESSEIFQKLCLSSALSILTLDSSLWLGCSPVRFWRCFHFSCLAFSLWKVNALLAFAEWYQQGSLGNYICK